jgi:hypothetical protein
VPTDGWTNAAGMRASEQVGRPPARAVRGDHAPDSRTSEGLDGGLDDGLEDASRQMTSADEAGDPALAGQALCVAQDVDRARVRAARDDDQPAVLDADDHVLVVPDHGIGLPVLAGACEVDRKSALEVGRALDLPRDEDGVVDEQRLPAFLHDVHSLGLEVGSTRRWQAELGPRRQDDLALAPRLGMDDQRQPQTSVAREQALEATVVIGVAVRDHDRAQILHRNLEHVEIAGQTVGGQSSVVQDAAPVPLALDRDQRREAVLRDELAAVAEVVLGVP